MSPAERKPAVHMKGDVQQQAHIRLVTCAGPAQSAASLPANRHLDSHAASHGGSSSYGPVRLWTTRSSAATWAQSPEARFPPPSPSRLPQQRQAASADSQTEIGQAVSEVNHFHMQLVDTNKRRAPRVLDSYTSTSKGSCVIRSWLALRTCAGSLNLHSERPSLSPVQA